MGSSRIPLMPASRARLSKIILTAWPLSAVARTVRRPMIARNTGPRSLPTAPNQARRARTAQLPPLPRGMPIRAPSASASVFDCVSTIRCCALSKRYARRRWHGTRTGAGRLRRRSGLSVGSPMISCQRSIGTWLIISNEPRPLWPLMISSKSVGVPRGRPAGPPHRRICRCWALALRWLSRLPFGTPVCAWYCAVQALSSRRFSSVVGRLPSSRLHPARSRDTRRSLSRTTAISRGEPAGLSFG